MFMDLNISIGQLARPNAIYEPSSNLLYFIYD